MTDRWKNILIGVFVLAAFAVGASLLLFTKPQFGDGKKTLKVRFSNISGINRGTRVTYAGRPIGEVVRIEEISNARENAVDNSGRVYFYQLLLRIDSKIAVYTSDEIALCTTGLMGEKSVATLPKAPRNRTSFAANPGSDHLCHLFDPSKALLRRSGAWVKRPNAPLILSITGSRLTGPAYPWLQKASARRVDLLNILLAKINEENLIPSLKETVEVAVDDMKMLRKAFDDDQLLSRLASMIAELNDALILFNTDGAQTIGNLNRITHDIATGSGTLGRLLTGEDFYLRLNSVMSKSETLMNDINHYGLLFQYNKQWQKSRTKRANLMNSLNSPKEFKDFFEGEIDSISTSLGRISEMLDRADQEPEREKIISNDAFKRDFVVLLRQVKALNDALHLFNQDLMTKAVP